MVRAFTAADVIQHDTGSVGGMTDPTTIVSLPNPASGGNSGLIVMGAQTFLAPPEQWHTAAGAGATDTSVQMGVMIRPDLPANDQSWVFATNTGAVANWLWVAEEWANISYAPLHGSARTHTQVGGSSISTGTTPAFTAPYVVGIAAVFMQGGTNAAAWSPVTWSNGFTETDVVQVGTGQASGDFQLRVARRYGTLDETGPWETTCTFTDGADPGKVFYACLAVFRAEHHEGEI
jgi:hypothetical protein